MEPSSLIYLFVLTLFDKKTNSFTYFFGALSYLWPKLIFTTMINLEVKYVNFLFFL
jgi:hypothetical protein